METIVNIHVTLYDVWPEMQITLTSNRHEVPLKAPKDFKTKQNKTKIKLKAQLYQQI